MCRQKNFEIRPDLPRYCNDRRMCARACPFSLTNGSPVVSLVCLSVDVTNTTQKQRTNEKWRPKLTSPKVSGTAEIELSPSVRAQKQAVGSASRRWGRITCHPRPRVPEVHPTPSPPPSRDELCCFSLFAVLGGMINVYPGPPSLPSRFPGHSGNGGGLVGDRQVLQSLEEGGRGGGLSPPTCQEIAPSAAKIKRTFCAQTRGGTWTLKM